MERQKERKKAKGKGRGERKKGGVGWEKQKGRGFWERKRKGKGIAREREKGTSYICKAVCNRSTQHSGTHAFSKGRKIEKDTKNQKCLKTQVLGTLGAPLAICPCRHRKDKSPKGRHVCMYGYIRSV
jgi:hypothetical protein